MDFGTLDKKLRDAALPDDRTFNRADAFEDCQQSPAPILLPREMQNVGLASFPSSTFLWMGSFVRSKRFGFFNKLSDHREFCH